MSGLRILVVEDEFLVADHLSMTLEDLGYEVVGPVPTVAEALAAIENEALDGALLDANLDGEGSTPVAEKLRAQAVPFVVCTGYGTLKLNSDLLDLAPRVTKPCSAQMLNEVLGATFAR